jgi:protein-disulfide isomerase
MTDEQGLTKKERKALNKQEKLATEAQEARNAWLRRWAMYGVIGLLLVAGWRWWQGSQVEIPEAAANKPVDQVVATDWVKGEADAPAILIEYSDFQCPACKAYAPLVEQMKELFGDQLAVVYRHYPLTSIHQQAELAAQAAEAAGKQGAFWEMHDLLFERQTEWSRNRRAEQLFIDYAEELGLNKNQFVSDLKSAEVKGLVKADSQNAVRLGLTGTPTFFLQGERIDNPRSEEAFINLITQALGATEAAQPEIVEEE